MSERSYTTMPNAWRIILKSVALQTLAEELEFGYKSDRSVRN